MAHTRTMSFSIDETIEPLIDKLCKKLKFRNRSALVNALIADKAAKHKIKVKK